MVRMNRVSSVPMYFVASESVSTSSDAAKRRSISFSRRRKSHIEQSFSASPEESSTGCSVTDSTPPVGSLRVLIQAEAARAKLPPISWLRAEPKGNPYFRSYAASTPTILRSSNPPRSRNNVPLSVPQPDMAACRRDATKSSRFMSNDLRAMPSLSLILSPMPLPRDSEYLFSYISARRAFILWLLAPMMSMKTSWSALEKNPFSHSVRSLPICPSITASSGSVFSSSRSPFRRSMKSLQRPAYELPSWLLM
mmetsp:Transcript_41640/g.83506  ORF Transcript_41640/g.83506 Transcript_41640/m.83506 type:complete len:252 (-) Transcript_41640:695-1450(-)